MNKKIVIIVGIVLLVVIAGGSYLWSQKNVDPTHINMERTESSNAVSTIGIKKMDTSTWQLLKNEKFNYEFKLPKNWSAKDGVDKQEGLLVIKDENNKETLTISTVQPRKEEKLFKGLCYNLLHKEDTIKCKKAENGVLKYKTGLGYSYNTTDYDAKESRSNERFIILANERLTFSIVDYSKNTNTIDNILNSIKVGEKRVDVMPIDAIKYRLDGEFKLDGNIDTSNWKTYKNEKYGYKLKIPEDWMCFEEAGVEKYKRFHEKSRVESMESLNELIMEAERAGDVEMMRDWQENLEYIKTEPIVLYNTKVICLNANDKQNYISQNWGIEPGWKVEDGLLEFVKIEVRSSSYRSPLVNKYAPIDAGIYGHFDLHKSSSKKIDAGGHILFSDKKNVSIFAISKHALSMEVRKDVRQYTAIAVAKNLESEVTNTAKYVIESFEPIN